MPTPISDSDAYTLSESTAIALSATDSFVESENVLIGLSVYDLGYGSGGYGLGGYGSSFSEAVDIALSASESSIVTDLGTRIIFLDAIGVRTVQSTAAITVLLPLVNDERTGAIDVSGLSVGAFQTFDNTTGTDNAADPAFIHAGFNSIWYKYVPTNNGTVRFQTGPQNPDENVLPYIDTLLGAYTYSGSYTAIAENDDSSEDPNGNSSLISFTVTAGTTYYIAVASKISTKYVDVSGLSVYGVGPGTLSWNLVSSDSTLTSIQVTLSSYAVASAPVTLVVTVSDVHPGDAVTASIGGTQYGAGVADSTGVASFSIFVPQENAGTYTVSVVTTSSGSGSADFLVLNSPSSGGFGLATPPPVHAAEKWRFYDPLEITTYDFAINPDVVEAPYFQRTLTSAPTTRVDGQDIVWEGNIKPVTWTWSGYIKDQAQYDAFVAYFNLTYRIVLYDHLGRTCVIYLTNFEPQPLIKADPNPYLMRYQMSALIYDIVGP